MRKILILFVSFFVLAANAQIIYNKMENDSTRVKVAGMTCCRNFTDTQVLNVGLQQIIVNSDTAYFIAICINQNVKGDIPTDGRMLLKTKKDEIIELYNSASIKYQLVCDNGTTTTAYRVGRTINVRTRQNTATFNQIIGYYPIGEQILGRLFEGVTKIKIELTPNNYQKVFRKDKVGKAIRKHYLELKHDTFEENF
jgi:uncharacterized protein YggE